MGAAASEERLVKSTERVRDLGEVFTPKATVKEMLDLLPSFIWRAHPSYTFLEPACGDGNFLVEILDRKLKRITNGFSRGNLRAGDSVEAAQFHALEALSSIYAVDISKDNIVGGRPGHEVGARTRLLNVFIGWHEDVLEKSLSERSLVLRSAEWIVVHNLIIGNMLPFDAEGKPTGRDSIPLIEYEWIPEELRVSLQRTTLGAVIETEKAAASDVLTLFGPPEPESLWSGNAFDLCKAERSAAPKLRGPARNGKGRVA